MRLTVKENKGNSRYAWSVEPTRVLSRMQGEARSTQGHRIDVFSYLLLHPQLFSTHLVARERPTSDNFAVQLEEGGGVD